MLKKITTLSLHLALLALAVAIAAYWIVKIVTPAPVAAPPPPPAAAAREANPVMAARMFGLVQTTPVAASNLQLLGVFAAGRSSSAVIAADGKPPRVVLLGQPVSTGVRLAAVARDGVTLDRNGVTQQLKMPPRPLPESKAQPAAAAGFTRDGNTLSAPAKTAAGAAATTGSVVSAVPQPTVAQAPAPPQAVPAMPVVQPPPTAASVATPQVQPKPRSRAARRSRVDTSED
jgi:general secretion pathway protein C